MNQHRVEINQGQLCPFSIVFQARLCLSCAPHASRQCRNHRFSSTHKRLLSELAEPTQLRHTHTHTLGEGMNYRMTWISRSHHVDNSKANRPTRGPHAEPGHAKWPVGGKTHASAQVAGKKQVVELVITVNISRGAHDCQDRNDVGNGCRDRSAAVVEVEGKSLGIIRKPLTQVITVRPQQPHHFPGLLAGWLAGWLACLFCTSFLVLRPESHMLVSQPQSAPWPAFLALTFRSS